MAAYHLCGGLAEALGVGNQPCDVGRVLRRRRRSNVGRNAGGTGRAARGHVAVGARNDVTILAGRVEALQRSRQPRRPRPQKLGILSEQSLLVPFLHPHAHLLGHRQLKTTSVAARHFQVCAISLLRSLPQ